MKDVILKFLNNNLLNKNGKLEAQRLKEKWFIKNNFDKEWELFKNFNTSKDLYMYLNDETQYCECGNEKRFVGFTQEFKEYCEVCARSKNNHMKKPGSKDIELTNIIVFLKDKNNNYSTSKIKKLSEKTIDNIIKRTNYLNKDTKISERLYHIEKNIFELPKCGLCGKEHNNFKFSTNGYSRYCKGKCSKVFNLEERIFSQKKYHYNNYVKKFKSNKDYDITLFSFDDYLNDNTNIIFKHNVCGHEYTLNVTYQGHLKCPKCYPIRSKKQYEIYEWLNNFTECSMNERQTIKPLEIDIMTNNFGIEYDSLTFHSFGDSKLSFLNNRIENKNIHLNKTELLEQKDKQLFRIFSNEWINNQDIWKSVLLSKLGKTKKLFARKCTIKEVSTKDSKDFLERNHLQGSINSSVRLGLYYDGILVSLMTFGKTRRSKWKGTDNYELYRFCTVLDTTVIGGASKLLKYFERNYNPNLVISYANRRWSTGNLYEKIGFEFLENSNPNYFYFKGGDSAKLLSREQFQKHKLKDKLEFFDESLTETENMFNNKYRKIYDCGNKVYIKKYK